jgi:hypothetical protein
MKDSQKDGNNRKESQKEYRMPISNASFMDPKSPVAKLEKIMNILSKGSIEAHFTDEKNAPTLSREYLEMAFQDYAISQQNPQIMNKWIALDTKLDKNLLEYVSEVKLLIASVIQTGMGQQSAAEPLNMPSPPSPGEGLSQQVSQVDQTQSRELPISRQE